MPHKQQPDGRIPLPQLPPLSFDTAAESDYDVQFQSSSSSEAKPWVSAIYTEHAISAGDRDPFDKDTSTSSTKHDSTGDPSVRLFSSTSPKASKAARTQNWFTKWFLEWWMMEILSWFFGLACMVIVAVVLLKHDGKPVPQWKIGLSIGSVISIFSGFAKSALLLPTAEGKNS
jgi:hypothetical protein